MAHTDDHPGLCCRRRRRRRHREHGDLAVLVSCLRGPGVLQVVVRRRAADVRDPEKITLHDTCNCCNGRRGGI